MNSCPERNSTVPKTDTLRFVADWTRALKSLPQNDLLKLGLGTAVALPSDGGR